MRDANLYAERPGRSYRLPARYETRAKGVLAGLILLDQKTPAARRQHATHQRELSWAEFHTLPVVDRIGPAVRHIDLRRALLDDRVRDRTTKCVTGRLGREYNSAVFLADRFEVILHEGPEAVVLKRFPEFIDGDQACAKDSTGL